MATFIQAVVAYGPRIKRKPTVREGELAERLADVTGLRPSEVMRVLLELQAALLHFNRRGAPLELPGIGTFTPSLTGDGRIHMRYRPARALQGALDNPQTYQGEIVNAAHVGFTPEEYKALWDAEHPDDPLELPVMPGGTARAEGVTRRAAAWGRRGARAAKRPAAAPPAES